MAAISAGLTLAGCALICTLPISNLATAAALAGWLTLALLGEFRRQAGVACCALLELDVDGAIRVTDSCGNAQSARLMAGSFVGRRLAWLRLKTERNGQIAELLADITVEMAAWRRLQLLWQLRRQRFGGFQGT